MNEQDCSEKQKEKKKELLQSNLFQIFFFSFFELKGPIYLRVNNFYPFVLCVCFIAPPPPPPTKNKKQTKNALLKRDMARWRRRGGGRSYGMLS